MKILIVGGAPNVGLASRILRAAASCDEVIAADSGAAACLGAGVVPDVVVGDMDSLDSDVLAELQTRGVELRVAPAEKDETDLDLAVAVARERRASSVVFVGITGGRLDHTLASIGSLVRAADLLPVLSEPDVEGWFLSEGGRARLDVEGHATRTVSMLSPGGAVVSCVGFRYPLDRERLDPLSSRGVSNIVDAGSATIEVHEGALLVLLIPAHD